MLGLSIIASIVYEFNFIDPNLAKTVVGILLVMFGIIEIKERRLA